MDPAGLDDCAVSARRRRRSRTQRIVRAPAEPEHLGSAQPPTTRVDGLVRRGTGWRWAVSAAGVLVVAMVIIAALAFKLGSGSPTSANRPSPTPTPEATATPLPATDVYRQVVPSVVLITTSKGSLGSGVIVTDTGTVLTAHHVIADGGASRSCSPTAPRRSRVGRSQTPSATSRRSTREAAGDRRPGDARRRRAVGAAVVAIGNPLGLTPARPPASCRA